MDEEVLTSGLPERRAGHIAVAAGKFILVWGGYNDEEVR
jgi:hypothetical protein